MNVFDANPKQNDRVSGSDYCGSIFVTDSITDEQYEQMKRIESQSAQYEKRSTMSKAVLVLYISLIIIMALSSSALSGSLVYSCLYQRIIIPAWYPAAALVLSAAGWLALHLTYAKKESDAACSPEREALDKEIDSLNTAIESRFKVTRDSYFVTVLMKYYSTPKGSVRINGNGYISYYFTAYVEGGCFNLSDSYQKLSFPLSSLTGIKKVDRRLRYGYWNDLTRCIDLGRESPRKHKPGNYSVSVGYRGTTIKPYYVLGIDHLCCQYELLIPPYELNTFMELLKEK